MRRSTFPTPATWPVYRTPCQYRHAPAQASRKEVKELGTLVVGYKEKQTDGSWKIAWNVVSDTRRPTTPPRPAARRSSAGR